VGAVDRAQAAGLVVTTLAERLARRGFRVLVVDLSARQVLSGAVTTGRAGAGVEAWASPVVVHPGGDPTLASGPRGTGRRPASRPAADEEDLVGLWGEADVVLALVEIDPGIDLDLLGTWVSQLVPLVSAGRASHELLTTVAALVDGADLAMPFALLEGVDRADHTLGRPIEGSVLAAPAVAVQSR
jgi:hypothetical protein